VHCAWEYKAQGVTAAQMNLFFGLGAIAVDGEAFVAQYKQERLADPAILDVISRVNAYADSEIEAMGAPGRHAVKMKLFTRDGNVFEKEIYHRRGSPENPLSREEVEYKFRALTRDYMEERRSTQIIDLVRSLDSLETTEPLTTLLAQPLNGSGRP
jgi:2-methylcitrate dehydratase PrpD